MRTTLVVTLDEDVQEFLSTQGTIDPTGMISMLIHQDMERQGFKPSRQAMQAQEDSQKKEMELLLDQDTPAAG